MGLYLALQLVDSEQVALYYTKLCGVGLEFFIGLSDHQEAGEDIGVLEKLLGVPEVDDLLNPGLLPKEPAQRLPITCLHPFVCDHEREPAAGAENLDSPLVEVYVHVGHAVEGLVVPLEIGFDRAQQFLSHVRRISDNGVKPTPLEDARELCLPVVCFWSDRRIVHHAIAAADVSG